MPAKVDESSEINAVIEAHGLRHSTPPQGEAVPPDSCEGRHNRKARTPGEPSPRELDTIRRLVESGRHPEAKTAGRKLIRRYTHSSLAWELLAVVLHRGGKTGEAIPALQMAASLSPEKAEIRYNLANLLRIRGSLCEAEAAYRAALALKPNYADAQANLGVTLQADGNAEEAVLCYRRAIAIEPRNVAGHSFLAIALAQSGQVEAAEAHCRRVIEIDPELAEAHSNLGGVLAKSGRQEEAEACCRRAIALKPDLAAAWNNLGETLQAGARNREAIDAYRKAIALNPGHSDAYSNLLLCLSHEEAVGPDELFAAHLAFGRRVENPLRGAWPQHTNSRDPERTLKIGFVSGDFRDHAAAFFLEPILPHLAATPGLTLHGYSNSRIEDETTLRLRKYFGRWRRVAGVAEVAIAAQVEADSIDILIDLSGHTNGNRLPVFARKPAPVQVSWLGYPGTTGLEAMDYFLGDRFHLPLDRFAGQFTEKLVHLAAVGTFLPSREAPPVNALPALSNGYLTLGSFNRPAKLSFAVVALWARLLRALPQAKMLIGGLAAGRGQSDLIGWFAKEGIGAGRLRLYPRSGLCDYLALHHEVDFCLDAFPYAGATTTYHGLWMGVPTLTLEGSTPAGRDGATVLRHVGLDSFVAEGKEQFVEMGLRWAGDLDALAEIRSGLRERFAKSPISHPEVIAASMAEAFRIIWRRWCAGLPPEAF